MTDQIEEPTIAELAQELIQAQQEAEQLQQVLQNQFNDLPEKPISPWPVSEYER